MLASLLLIPGASRIEITNPIRLFFIALLLTLPIDTFSQKNSFSELELNVYTLNNQLKFSESQALLLPILQSNTYSADNKYEASLLLSHTYKRVFDYESALKYLKSGQTFAEASRHKHKYLAEIQSELAFIFFDTHQYKQADSLMKKLDQTDFAYIDLENKSKLVMQQGYLLFMRGKYREAEATYDKAIGWMRVSDPCDLPMIFVKKMQLYAAMQRNELLEESLRKATFYADSCHIIKYNLYAYEELRGIYKKQNNPVKLAETQIILDSLEAVYAKEKNISLLHNQKENYTNQTLDQRTRYVAYLKIGLVIVCVVALALLTWLVASYRRQRRIETEYNHIQAELDTYISQNKIALIEEKSSERPYLDRLSERQREVLDFMTSGLSNKAIAQKLSISENTVKYHIKNIYQTLDISDRKELLLSVKK